MIQLVQRVHLIHPALLRELFRCLVSAALNITRLPVLQGIFIQ